MVALLKKQAIELRHIVSLIVGGATINGIQYALIGSARTDHPTTGVKADADEGFAVSVFHVARDARAGKDVGELTDLCEREMRLSAFLDALARFASDGDKSAGHNFLFRQQHRRCPILMVSGNCGGGSALLRGLRYRCWTISNVRFAQILWMASILPSYQSDKQSEARQTPNYLLGPSGAWRNIRISGSHCTVTPTDTVSSWIPRFLQVYLYSAMPSTRYHHQPDARSSTK